MQVSSSYKLPTLLIIMILSIYTVLIFYLFPLYTQGSILPGINIALVFFTLMFMIISMFKNPGTVEKAKQISFSNILDEFDPILLCPDC